MSASEQTCRERSSFYAAHPGNEHPEDALRGCGDEGFLALDRDWRYVYVNGAAAEWLGRAREALLGRVLWEIEPSLVGTALYDACMGAMSEQAPAMVESRLSATEHRFVFHLFPSPDGLHVRFRAALPSPACRQQDLPPGADIPSGGERYPAGFDPCEAGPGVTESGSALVARYDRDGRHLYAAPIAPYPPCTTAECCCGRTNEELAIPERSETRERWTEAVSQALQTAVTTALVLREEVNGAVRTYLIRFLPEISLEDRQVSAVTAIAEDVTERLQAEDRLLRSAERYRTLANVTAKIVWTCDPNGACREPSPTWEAFTGRNAAAIEGHGYLDVIHGDDRAEVQRHWSAALADGAPCQLEYRVRRRDGLWRTVLTRAAPLRDPVRGGAIREWICASTDVTERRAIEAALRASEERYAAISSMTSDYAFAYRLERDGNLRLEWITDAFTEISGYTAEELDHMGWNALLDAEDVVRAEEMARRTLVYGDEMTLEARMRTRSAEIRWLRVYLRPRYGHGGAIAGFYGAAQDITEQKRAEAELRAAHQKQRRIAETLQDSLLITPPEDAFPGLEIHTRYAAAWEEATVGGDFHDAFVVSDRRVALLVGDVMGKGLAAAASTAEIKFALRALLREHRCPGAALERLNEYILVSQHLNPTPETALVSIVLAVVDTATGEMEVATAGAEPPLLLRRDSMMRTPPAMPSAAVASPGAPMLGITTGFTYPVAADRLREGDLLLLFTDGLTEARVAGKGTRFFGAAGVAGAVRQAGAGAGAEASSPAALSAIGRAVLDAVRAFAQRDRLDDDLCLMLVRRRTAAAAAGASG